MSSEGESKKIVLDNYSSQAVGWVIRYCPTFMLSMDIDSNRLRILSSFNEQYLKQNNSSDARHRHANRRIHLRGDPAQQVSVHYLFSR